MRQRSDTAAGFGVGESCRAPSKINLRPSQTQRLAAAPARERKEPCRAYCGRPETFRLALTQRSAQRGIFVITQPPLAFPIGKALDAMNGIVGAHPVANCICEDRAEQPYRASCRCPAASHAPRLGSRVRIPSPAPNLKPP